MEEFIVKIEAWVSVHAENEDEACELVMNDYSFDSA